MPAPAHQSANIGQLVHALAQRVAERRGRAHLDGPHAARRRRPRALHFRTPWSADREHERIAVALNPVPRVARRQPPHARRPPTQRFETVVPLKSGEQRHPLRVRRPARARRRRPRRGRRPEDHQERNRPVSVVQRHVQLGLYQYAVDHGAVDALRAATTRPPDRPASSGGAELVQLGLARRRLRARPAAAGVSPTTAPSAPRCAAQLDRAAGAGPCRASRRSPATTAATAPSSRSARSRAPAR